MQTSLLSSRRRAGQTGSTLVVALCTVVVLALIAGNVLMSMTARYNSAYRSASWNEAMLTAESGVDVTMSEIFRIVPNVSIVPAQGLGVGFSQPSLGLITGLNFSLTGLLTNGTLLNVNPPALVHGGEGGTTQQATVALDVVPLSTLLNNGVPGLLNSVTSLLGGGDLQLLRIRSIGTVYLTGGRVASPSRLDNDLWQPSLITDRFTGQATQPSISRQVEVLMRPVYPFESAIASDGAFSAPNATIIFDSFNSTLNTASTGGQYDSLKRLQHGIVRSNSSAVTIGGTVYGDINTNGGNILQDSHVTGTVNNSAYSALPVIAAPTFAGALFVPGTITGNTSLAAGVLGLPAQYKFTAISGNLHITRGLLGLGTNVEIYVNGDVTGGIEIDPGIAAKVYVSGSIITNASKLKNDSLVANNFQLYGVPNATGTTQQITITSDANLVASIYAPAHNFTITGASDFSGAIACKAFTAAGAVRIHFDEALAANIGPLLRYEIASWKEIVSN